MKPVLLDASEIVSRHTQVRSERSVSTPSGFMARKLSGLSTPVLAGKGSTQSLTEKTTAENVYEAKAATALTLADRQTIRDVERLFGRPFRVAGAVLADQGTATSLLAGKPFNRLAAAENEAARKEREALVKVADIVIEVLISSRQVSVLQVSGEQTFVVPDIQATVNDITEATALALMEDMAAGGK